MQHGVEAIFLSRIGTVQILTEALFWSRIDRDSFIMALLVGVRGKGAWGAVE
jgi:hypothetical protein